MARVYSGSLYNLPLDLITSMSLVKVQQNQESIHGSFIGFQANGLQVNEPFRGLVDDRGGVQFTFAEYAGQIPLSFSGSVQSDGTLAGDYCSLDSERQCAGEYGIWSVTPTSGGGSQ
jgi:eukaryotic-like serine/threonine-protein kinase